MSTEESRIGAQDLLDLSFVADPQVSPTGERIAAVVTTIVPGDGGEPPRYRSRIVLFEVGAPEAGPGDHVEPAGEEPAFTSERPRFSPDGELLAFLSKESREAPAQLWLAHLGGNEPPRRLTDTPGGVGRFAWQPDGSAITCLARAEKKPESPPVKRVIDRLVYSADGKGYLPAQPPLLLQQPLDGTGERLELPEALIDIHELVWSPDGRQLLLVADKDVAERDEALSRLWRFTPGTGELVPLTEALNLHAPVPSPDGQQVAFLAPAVGRNGAGPTALWLVPVAGGEARRVSDPDSDLAPALGGDSRYGEYRNDPVWLGADELLVNHNSEGVSSLHTLRADGRLKALQTGSPAVVTAFSRAGGVTAFTREDSATPGELFMLDADGKEARLTALNRELGDRLGFVRAQGPFVPDESTGAAYWRLEPAAAREDRAHVLQVHGGPHTNVGEGFYFEFQLLAARGYTVIYGNPRGSSSYGNSFATAILGAYGQEDERDLLAFVDHAMANQPEGTPVHLTGGSYGGFMTNWLTGRHERFRSAVTQRSICNFVSFYGTSDIGHWFTERELGGNAWENPRLLWEQSPLRNAHRIETPLLILHAEADLRCPLEQAQQLFTAVKRTGKADTQLVLFPEESHELSRSGRPDRRVERLEAIVGWFERHA